MSVEMSDSVRARGCVVSDGEWETVLRGREVLGDPLLNKGTAFTPAERNALGLIGLLPPRVLTIGQQAARVYEQYQEQPTNLAKNLYLMSLHNRNETLFYRVLTEHLPEMLPIVYTPTVGEAIQRYSHEYRRPRGVYLSVDQPEQLERSLLDIALGPDDVDLIVATDAEGILGIGDWGVGGIDIAIGKLAVYTAAAGINPARGIPVMLDVGTNRQSLLDDPFYLGNRHPRVPEETYDAFIQHYVDTATRLFPHALLHWEDFGTGNARRILQRYRDRVLSFNDDMQGTGAIALAAVLSALRVTGHPLREQRIVVFGSGTGGIGIADQLRDAIEADGLTREEAAARFWCVGRHGLLTGGMSLRDFQVPYARPASQLNDWPRDGHLGGISLAEVVRQIHPTILIGTSTESGAFTEGIVREMAAHVERPIIMPLSNPTPLAEAVPADLIRWTDGRALVGTGSPFEPTRYNGTSYVIGQVNNALVFPGLGLGAIVARATRITDGMFRAAACAVAELADATGLGAALLPAVDDLRTTSVVVATAVARAAQADGVAQAPLEGDVRLSVEQAMWSPDYRPVRAI